MNFRPQVLVVNVLYSLHLSFGECRNIFGKNVLPYLALFACSGNYNTYLRVHEYPSYGYGCQVVGTEQLFQLLNGLESEFIRNT